MNESHFTIELIKIHVEKESGWFSGVCRAIPDPERDRKLDFPGEILICGTMPFRHIGIPYRVKGEMGKYRNNAQLKISKGTVPERVEGLIDLDGIDRYLSTIKKSLDQKRSLSGDKSSGIGSVAISRLIDTFKEDCVKIAREDPERVSREVRGWSSEKASIFSEELKCHVDQERAIMELMTLSSNRGLSADNREQLLSKYGVKAPDVVREDPYLLIESLDNYGFLKADTIAVKNLLWNDASPARLKSANREALRKIESDGHCYTKAHELCRIASQLTSKNKLYHELLIPQDECIDLINGVYAASVEVIEAEERIIRFIKERSERGPLIEKENSRDAILTKGLNEEQLSAFKAAMNGGILVVNGGPGRGKTYTCRSIISGLSLRGRKVLILAPTGRAAARASEVTGSESMTMHSYLKRITTGSSFSQYSTFIIDESSMIDVRLMGRFLESLLTSQSVVFVGDCDQLPPVQCGTPFFSLIESGAVETVTLEKVMRTDKFGLIKAASTINGGSTDVSKTLRDLSSIDESFLFAPTDNADSKEIVLSILKEWIQDTAPEDIQLITATNGYKGGEGPIKALSNRYFNLILQPLLNPKGEPLEAYASGDKLHKGDRIMNLKNNSQIPLMNGEMGIVVGIEEEGKKRSLVCDFGEGRVVKFPLKTNKLVLAFAVTCHKFQGSECGKVIVVFDNSASRILDSSWLYTAITRASKSVSLIAPKSLINRVCKTPSKLKQRRSFLSAKLKKTISQIN